MADAGRRIRRRPRGGRQLFRGAIAAAAVAIAGSACAQTSSPSGITGQGIYPSDPSKDGYKLPGGFEPVVRLRTYYFDQEQTNGGAKNEAWAVGGWAGLRSPWWGEWLQLALVGYTSQPLHAPDGKGGTNLLTADQDSITVLGEAFAAMRLAGQTVTAYRQLIDRPFINTRDNRMLPNTFEAYTLAGKFDQVSYIGGYITKMKQRGADSFVWMSDTAGGKGAHRGLAFAGATYGFGKGYVRVDEQYAEDVFNSFYTDVRYPIALDKEAGLVLGAQYYPQRSVGDAQIGSFSTWGYGLDAEYSRGPFGVQLYWTQTGKGGDTRNPFGTHPSYLDLMQVSFNTAGEKAWGISADIDFQSLGAPGLTADVIYADGHGRIDAATGAPKGNRNETNVRVDYAFAKDSTFRGLIATLRYSWLHEDGTKQTGTQLRVILNYAVPF